MMTKVCPICQRSFTAIRRATRTCGRSDCQELLKRKKAGMARPCPVCGREFIPRRYASRKLEQQTCSGVCGARQRVLSGRGSKPGRHKPRPELSCEWCHRSFQPKGRRTRRFCGKECSRRATHALLSARGRKPQQVSDEVRRRSSERMKQNNPMNDPVTRAKAIAAKQGRGWLDTRGGHGAPMPEPQRLLHERLGWPTEYPVVTGNPKWHAALMDLAHPDLKIAVECDGPSHQSKQQQVRDRIKERMLNDLGWIVLRFTNEVILERTAMVLEQIQSVAQQRA